MNERRYSVLLLVIISESREVVILVIVERIDPSLEIRSQKRLIKVCMMASLQYRGT